ncbi:phosphoribosylaminoimidazole carboxylase [Endozoicomonas sp. OPT23]|uniref:cupin domain-containing protein n=1 Tax=Endozoicomonas sp. OPT23 TaxID=2072845 RepID=UPI00129AD634|nr:cupin domain-containing protein [Endozoicomonas sp. OPT23]MRI35063.1 phosphoribosylaminoimidazole carboxylase [Endozoicomonas sp. OPT23]
MNLFDTIQGVSSEGSSGGFSEDCSRELPGELPEELIEVLAENDNVTIERIVSRGHATPKGEWYDQPRDEWVVLLSGAARLKIEGQDQEVEMKAGDYLLLPAHLRHRVEWTDPATESVWLAVHY